MLLDDSEGNYKTHIYEPELFGEDLWQRNLTIDAPALVAGEHNITISLVWNDPPAVARCSACLVHDLDLTVVLRGSMAPSQTYFPNFRNHPDAHLGDHVNNVERVIIPKGLLCIYLPVLDCPSTDSRAHAHTFRQEICSQRANPR